MESMNENYLINFNSDFGEIAFYAAEELKYFLDKIYINNFQLRHDADGKPGINLYIDKALDEEEYVIKFNGSLQCGHISAGSGKGLLYGVYHFLENEGIVFGFGKTHIRDSKDEFIFRDIYIKSKPDIDERGIRMHINFPMDQSSYTLAETCDFIDGMARLRQNYLVLHFYDCMPWFDFEYNGLKNRTGGFFYNSKHLVPDIEGVRGKVRNKEIYCIPEMEEFYDDKEKLYEAAQLYINNIIDHAHKRGIKVGVSYEPMSMPKVFNDSLKEWNNGQEVTQFDINDPLIMDIADSRFAQLIKLYDNADEYILMSIENTTGLPSGSDAESEINNIRRKYNMGDDWAVFEKEGTDTAKFLAASLVSIEFFINIVSSARKKGIVADDKKITYSIYMTSAEANELIAPALCKIVEPNSRVHLLPGYGAMRVSHSMKKWQAFNDSGLSLGLATWLEFDGLMFMPQNAINSIGENIDLARKYCVNCIYTNHWRLSELDAIGTYAAHAIWDNEMNSDDFYDWYLPRLYGDEAAPFLKRAYEMIEAATDYATDNLFNIGFSWDGWWRIGRLLKAGDNWRILELREGRKLYSNAMDYLNEGMAHIRDGQGANLCRYIINKIEFGINHIDVVECLIEVSLILKKYDMDIDRYSRDRLSHDDAERMDRYIDKAKKLSRNALIDYAKYIADRGDEGMMVSYYKGPVMSINELYAFLKQEENTDIIDNDECPIPIL
jgi:hypothetical protein